MFGDDNVDCSKVIDPVQFWGSLQANSETDVLWKLNNKKDITDKKLSNVKWEKILSRKVFLKSCDNKRLTKNISLHVNAYLLKIVNSSQVKWLNEQERMANVLAYREEEGRRKRRNAAGRCTRSTIRGYPNGATRPGWRAWPSSSEYITSEKSTQGIETS